MIPLFLLFIFEILQCIHYIHSITFIQYIHPSPFAEVSLRFLISGSSVGKKSPWGTEPSMEPVLSYLKPTHYQLSYGAPQILLRAGHQIERNFLSGRNSPKPTTSFFYRHLKVSLVRKSCLPNPPNSYLPYSWRSFINWFCFAGKRKYSIAVLYLGFGFWQYSLWTCTFFM